MLPFLHARRRTLNGLLERAGQVLAKFNALDLDLAPALAALLDGATVTYRELGRATVENRVLALSADHVAAAGGTNPYTLEHASTGRRTMQRAVALRTLQVLTEQLRADLDADARALADATALLRPIVLAGAHKGVVPLPWPSPGDVAAVERLWRAIAADDELRLAARQVAMQVSVYDIPLLLGALLEAAG